MIAAAIRHADKEGLAELTMRTVAAALGVAPMALYRHVANKEDLIDGMVDAVFAEVALPSRGADWRAAMRKRATSLRDALARHRWANGLMESRARAGAATLRHHDAMIGSLRDAGFSMKMTAHAYSLIDSYIYGFALTQMSLPFEPGADLGALAKEMLRPFGEEFPNLAAFAMEHVAKPGYDFAKEFEFGLQLVLDSLDGLRSGTPVLTPRRRPSAPR